MTTKRWGSLAIRENSATNSRNLGRHSESIIQPGGRRGLGVSVLAAASRVAPHRHPPRSRQSQVLESQALRWWGRGTRLGS